jgi:hypothetical protein
MGKQAAKYTKGVVEEIGIKWDVIPASVAGSDCKNLFRGSRILVFHPDTGLRQFPCLAGS